jgi:hypothetical protein
MQMRVTGLYYLLLGGGLLAFAAWLAFFSFGRADPDGSPASTVPPIIDADKVTPPPPEERRITTTLPESVALRAMEIVRKDPRVYDWFGDFGAFDVAGAERVIFRGEDPANPSFVTVAIVFTEPVFLDATLPRVLWEGYEEGGAEPEAVVRESPLGPYWVEYVVVVVDMRREIVLGVFPNPPCCPEKPVPPRGDPRR